MINFSNCKETLWTPCIFNSNSSLSCHPSHPYFCYVQHCRSHGCFVHHFLQLNWDLSTFLQFAQPGHTLLLISPSILPVSFGRNLKYLNVFTLLLFSLSSTIPALSFNCLPSHKYPVSSLHIFTPPSSKAFFHA